MGIDVGLVEDGTAVSITHAESDYISLDYHEIWYAGVDWKEANPHLHGEYTREYAKTLGTVERLDFSEIADWIETLAKRFHITAGLFDRWIGIPLEQALHKKGLNQFKAEFFTRDQNSKIYQAVKSFILDGRMRIYDYPIPERAKEGQDRHSPLITELLSLEARQLSKNIVLVQAPQVKGNHDDLSDSFVRAAWLSMNVLVNQKHVAGGGLSRPRASSSMTAERYQRIRDRQRGYIGDRRVPRRRSFLR
jgi:hypothetical protein